LNKKNISRQDAKAQKPQRKNVEQPSKGWSVKPPKNVEQPPPAVLLNFGGKVS
jgi:hypothetical protein